MLPAVRRRRFAAKMLGQSRAIPRSASSSSLILTVRSDCWRTILTISLPLAFFSVRPPSTEIGLDDFIARSDIDTTDLRRDLAFACVTCLTP